MRGVAMARVADMIRTKRDRKIAEEEAAAAADRAERGRDN
jgi:hypothetical protein